MKVEETRKRVHERLANDELAQRGPDRPPKAAASLEQVEQDVEATYRDPCRLARQRETVTQSIRAISHTYNLIDGVWRAS